MNKMVAESLKELDQKLNDNMEPPERWRIINEVYTKTYEDIAEKVGGEYEFYPDKGENGY